MDERRGFVEAIRSAPDDFVLPLVFADWLDENGEPILAQSIRLWHADGIGAKFDWDRFGQSKWAQFFASPEFQPYRKTGFSKSGKDWYSGGLMTRVNCQPHEWLRFGKTIAPIWPIREVRLSWPSGMPWFGTRLDTPTLLDRQQVTGPYSRWRLLSDNFGIPVPDVWRSAAETKAYVRSVLVDWALDFPVKSYQEWRESCTQDQTSSA